MAGQGALTDSRHLLHLGVGVCLEELQSQVNLLLGELLRPPFLKARPLLGNLLPLLGALHNQVALEVREGAEDGEDQPSGGRVLNHA